MNVTDLLNKGYTFQKVEELIWYVNEGEQKAGCCTNTEYNKGKNLQEPSKELFEEFYQKNTNLGNL